MTFPVKKIKVSGIGGYRGMEWNSYQQTTIVVNYNTNGTFNLSQPHEEYKDMPYGGPSVGLTLPMFDDIIRAFENTPVPRDRYQPFYRATFGPFGMMLSGWEVFGYFIKDKEGMVLERRSLTWDEVPSKHVEHVSMTLEEFKQCYEACKNYKGIYNYDVDAEPVPFIDLINQQVDKIEMEIPSGHC